MADGAHDPKANHKVYLVNANDDAVSYTCENWPGQAEKGGGEYKLPYEAAVGVVNGGWYEAAQLYREWALTAPWSKAGKISERPIPQWLKDTDMWLRVEFDYEGIAEADTLLLTVPNMLGVPYNAHVIESILKHVAPALGWR